MKSLSSDPSLTGIFTQINDQSPGLYIQLHPSFLSNFNLNFDSFWHSSFENLKMLSQAAEAVQEAVDLGQDFMNHGFRGLLISISKKVVDIVVSNLDGTYPHPHKEMIEQAEKDAGGFLAAVAESNLISAACSTPNENRLFLYATPLLTVIDCIFFSILDKFCDQHNPKLEKSSLDFNVTKRVTFYGNIASLWDRHADYVAPKLENQEDRQRLIESVANGFFSQPTGVFYFKGDGLTGFYRNLTGKVRASWRAEALELKTAENVMASVMSLSS